MVKITAFVLAVLFQLNCAAPAVHNQNLPPDSSDSRAAIVTPNKSGENIDRLVAKIKDILQEGWDVSRVDDKIFVTRRNPVFFYNGLALPLAGNSRRREIEKGKKAADYKITLEFADRLTEEQYQRLIKSNQATKLEFDNLESRMRAFAGKGDYNPSTPREKALYEEYKQALRALPFNRLPDLYDEQFSIYVETSRHAWAEFYAPREESECRAVLENIFSFAEPYGGQSNLTVDETFNENRVSAVFNDRREHDKYLWKKELNLRRP